MCAIARGSWPSRGFSWSTRCPGTRPRLGKANVYHGEANCRSGLTILLVEQQIHRAMQVASYALSWKTELQFSRGKRTNWCDTSISESLSGI